MKDQKITEALLLLEDGTLYKGKSCGKIGTTTGEICFNTGMTGYQEIFTDPSYYGQIMVMTTDHIGNYGAYDEDQESDSIKIAGLVCRNFTREDYSRKMATSSLQKYLEEQELVGISDLDTRAVVRHIRDKGTMNAIISSEILDVDVLKERLKKVPSMAGLELSTQVTTKEPYFYGDENAELKIAVLDLGIKRHILRSLAERGCYLKVFPAKATYEVMSEWGPNGYFISNGPGDPAPMDYAIETTRNILNNDHPLFGICLGHQIIALAVGISTYKMFNGHRGLNHPVKNLITGKAEITSQNHGFAISREDTEKNTDVEITHVHLNDKTIAGIRLKWKKAFSVQFHPEASPGPHDSRYLFDEFIEMVKSAGVLVSG